ncbi:insulinase family protein [Chloracidobacterium validum]|uniref:Insulinase family protein n=1 Tax=Chloracidobacterium validum TaxID=2821543 RepID=A0ABX8B998_9BACT|nr:pitrilysin family protein [Chloracidobacterium validum]QUW02631.1 insulinase family protein [Chloracidobacterium validum]
MRHCWLAGWLLIWFSASGWALPPGARGPAFQKPQPPRLEPLAERVSSEYAQLFNRRLANGLEVIVYEDHAVPLVTIELACRNGSYTEPPELNGLSHLYEHMFFKANRAVKNQEAYLRTIGELGIVYNGTTQTELVNYYFTTLSRNLPTALRFMRDAALYPAFDEEEFAREKEVVLGEIDRNESNPYYYLSTEMTQRLFAKYPSRKNPLGTRATVAAATTDQMRLIQQRYYLPNNAAVLVAGDVQPEEVFRLVAMYFGEWPRGNDPFKKYPPVEHPPLERSEGVIVTQPVQSVTVQIGWHGPSIGKDDAATYAADVFSFILRQPNSRFQRALVDSGLATGVDLIYITQRNVGPITLTLQTTPEKARAALKAVHAEVARFADPDYFTDEELAIAKTLLEADDLFSREKVSEHVHSLSFWWASTGLDYFRGYLPTLRQTSRADIQRYLRRYVIGQPHITVAMLSSDAQASLKLTDAELIGAAPVAPASGQ